MLIRLSSWVKVKLSKVYVVRRMIPTCHPLIGGKMHLTRSWRLVWESRSWDSSAGPGSLGPETAVGCLTAHGTHGLPSLSRWVMVLKSSCRAYEGHGETDTQAQFQRSLLLQKSCNRNCRSSEWCQHVDLSICQRSTRSKSCTAC